MLRGKRLLLGLSGSIAAYKSAFLLRLLVKAGADVQPLLTEDAAQFITPLTLATLAKRPALQSFVKNEEGEWHNHVEWGLWADALVVAPATARTLSRFANGYCDNLLVATYLSARCPVILAPAMDLDMYRHPSTQSNLQTLQSFGNRIIGAEEGELASGLSGQGRMAEPEHILHYLETLFGEGQPLAGQTVLLTAGPTHEPIDPVRYVGNRSTGTMGFALAERCANLGAKVILVAGPTPLQAQHPSIETLRVETAHEMYQAAAQHHSHCQVAIFAAAVADYSPSETAPEKIKKSEESWAIRMSRTTDIAAELGRQKKPEQFHIGFALETENEAENATQKLQKKNFDLVVLNSLKEKGAGFGTETNKIHITDKNGQTRSFPLKPKKEVAHDIIQTLLEYLPAPA